MNKSLRCLPVLGGQRARPTLTIFSCAVSPSLVTSGATGRSSQTEPEASQREVQGLEAYLGFPGAPFQPGGSLRPSKLPGTDGHPEGDGSSSRWAAQVCAGPETGPPGTALLGPTSPMGRRLWPCRSPLLLVWNPRSS